MQMYVASAGDADENGIYRYELDADSGSMQPIDANNDITNCLYLALHPTQPLLYAVGEAHIWAFQVAIDGSLTLINRQSTGGHEPCYVSVTGDGRYALIVNYAGSPGGSIGAFPLQDDGSLGAASTHINAPGDGASVHPTRQEAPHPHMILPTPDDSLVLVPDLGMDYVLVYRLNRESGQLEPHETPHIPIQAGSGPRHLAFHPTESVFYVLSELNPLLTVVSYDAAGRFQVVETYSTMPPGEDAPDNNLGADIHVTPSGRFLYASNRGHNTFAIFGIGAGGEQLSYVGHASTLGDWPRGFGLDPSGRVLVAANRRTDDVYTLHIDSDTGHLSPTGHKLTVSSPVCVKIR